MECQGKENHIISFVYLARGWFWGRIWKGHAHNDLLFFCLYNQIF